MNRSKAIRVAAAAVALSFAPASAYAVTVSANDGSGNQSRVTSYSNGARVDGKLRSTSGKSVYYSGKVALGNGCSDYDTGRYDSNTSSTTAVARGGTISTIYISGCGLQGVKSRICTVRTGIPDACGSDSSTY